ncbi:hypothetical protein, unknown function [Leishmania tarentolae]|uniref:Uncharacterized protein n=1 Tax=Leishmania tarentolae TaxID=5689 RepID=A0A640KQN5_LEITA|nr:hypothetical protein, unknown function [Leishmania tarentolae]
MPMLQAEEQSTTPTRSAENCIDSSGRCDEALRPGYIMTSPNSSYPFKEANSTTRGLVPMRGYMTLNTSDSIESSVVLHSPDRAAMKMVSGFLSVSEQRLPSNAPSSMKVGSDIVNVTLAEDEASEDVEDRSIDDDRIDDGYSNGVVFELYKPMEMRRPDHTFSKGSPLPPAVLTRWLPAGGVSGFRYNCSNGSREQASGRYTTLSQSSRFEDARGVPSHGGEMCKGNSICFDRTRAMIQEDVVRNSSADSLSIHAAGTAFQNSGQPQRIDSSMNSQSLFKVKQRRNVASASCGHGGSHHGSMSSPIESPKLPADVTVPTLMKASSPHLLCSDQMALNFHPRGENRSTHTNSLLHNQNHRHSDGNGNGEGASVLDVIVLSVASADPLTSGGEAFTTASMPITDGFDLVRAPITGLRAMVLGNNSIEEEEAVDDPEMRALQAEQLKHFYTKVVRHHRNCAKSGAPTRDTSLPTLKTKPALTPKTPQSLGIDDKVADCVALVHECGAPTLRPSFPLVDEGRAVVALESDLAKKSRKREKRVMFRNATEQEDAEGCGTAHLPHHSTPKQPLQLLSPAPPPLALKCGGAELTSISGEGEVNDLCSRESPPPPASPHTARGVLDMQNCLASTTSATTKMDMLTSSANETVPALALPVTPVRRALKTSALGTPQREDEEDEHTLTVPVTPSTPVNFAQQQLPTLTSMARPSPSPLALCTTLEKFSAIYAEAPRKRFLFGGRMSQVSTTCRKGSVAVVAGAGDTIVQPQSSTLSAPQLWSSSSYLVPPNALSSLEVCLPDRDSCKKSSTWSQTRLSISYAQKKPPLPRQVAEDSASTAPHFTSGGTTDPGFTPPFPRDVQANSDGELPFEPMKTRLTTAPLVATAPAMPTARQPKVKTVKSQPSAQHSSRLIAPRGTSHVVKTNPSLLPTPFSSQMSRNESLRDRAHTKSATPSVSCEEVSVSLPSVLTQRVSVSRETATTATSLGQVSALTTGSKSVRLQRVEGRSLVTSTRPLPG